MMPQWLSLNQTHVFIRPLIGSLVFLDLDTWNGSIQSLSLRSTGVFSEVVEAFDKAEANRQAEDRARDAVFRRQLADIQSGRLSRAVPQIVREARRRLRAKKHRLEVSAKLNASAEGESLGWKPRRPARRRVRMESKG